MINYECKYSNETWEASVIPIEKAKDYSRLRITSDLFNDVNVFLWHKDSEYWLSIPENEITCMLAYPTDTFGILKQLLDAQMINIFLKQYQLVYLNTISLKKAKLILKNILGI